MITVPTFGGEQMRLLYYLALQYDSSHHLILLEVSQLQFLHGGIFVERVGIDHFWTGTASSAVEVGLVELLS